METTDVRSGLIIECVAIKSRQGLPSGLRVFFGTYACLRGEGGQWIFTISLPEAQIKEFRLWHSGFAAQTPQSLVICPGWGMSEQTAFG
ncbi:MAG: hypothetical protein IH898_07330 [Planctomycetes bacterium]|nr:hypothetical protein [Planctomycetota bacterium]